MAANDNASFIDFTPTAYTVKSPGNGQQTRYEGGGWKYDIETARKAFERFAMVYPNMARLVVPDHYIQEYCRECDSASWSGSHFSDKGTVFMQLVEKALLVAKFS